MSELTEIERGVHNYSAEDKWVKPTDPAVLEKLEWFKDQKLALMMHWGPYSQIGLVESWALSDADGDWSRDDVDWEEDMEEFKRQYFNLNKTFNPIRFQPDKWAEHAKKAGFKYLIFTTKHHDGFSMWNTKQSDYRITGAACPFHTHRYADICKHVFDAFRKQGIGIAAYFSKADWHTPYYWAPGMERKHHMWRGPSYDPAEYPWMWENFVSFTHRQILELLTEYGEIDILWLDAGWVGKGKQDIRLGEVVAEGRKHQPGLLTADRTIGGEHENYITPEQTIPDRALHIPWESCISIATSFAFKYEDEYKSLREIVHALVEIVAKGGNLALNVPPQPDGRLPRIALERMEQLGNWLDRYGEAIYGTRITAPYFEAPFAFTKKGKHVFCFRLWEEGDTTNPATLHIPFQEKVEAIEWMNEQQDVTFLQDKEVITIEKVNGNKDIPIVDVFRFTLA